MYRITFKLGLAILYHIHRDTHRKKSNQWLSSEGDSIWTIEMTSPTSGGDPYFFFRKKLDWRGSTAPRGPSGQPYGRYTLRPPIPEDWSFYFLHKIPIPCMSVFLIGQRQSSCGYYICMIGCFFSEIL